MGVMKEALDMIMSQGVMIELVENQRDMEDNILYLVRTGNQVEQDLSLEYSQSFIGIQRTIGETLQAMAAGEPVELDSPFDGECTGCGVPRPSSRRQRDREGWKFRNCLLYTSPSPRDS